MRYQGLRFFNGTKTEIELLYDSNEELFKGSVYLDEVSTGLYETATIFILEEAVSQYGATKLVTPIGSNVGSRFKCEFVSDVNQSKDINIISAYLDNGEMYVKQESFVELELQDNSVATFTTDGIHTLGSSYTKDALQFTIALNSEEDKAHHRYLRIYDTIDDKLVANIYVYGETVGEDERLAVLLSNFGTSVTAKDQFLFKDHDINEIGTDWQLINRKRKELLLELSNIKPFIGTYKALINAIKFYGYNNLTLKEYWLMIDDRSPMFGKMKAIEVPSVTDGFVSKRKETVLPSSSYKKTSRFGLYYKLNEPNGNFDKFDIPEVDEVFDFTPDEVLVKLYGLKNKLQKEYLPLNARIIDIIGEGDFFAGYNINVWNNQNPITEIVAGIDPEIKVHTTEVYIEDLEKVSTIFEGKGQDFSKVKPSDMQQAYEDVENFYDNYYNIDRTSFNSNNTDAKIGAPVMLECTSFLESWDDAEFTFDDAESFITWENWWKQNIYELRWRITGPKNFSVSIVGGIDDYMKVALALPYSGKYSIVFEQVDLFNNVMVLRYPDVIDVRVKPVEFYSVHRWLNEYSENLWNKSSVKWKNAGGDWNFPQQNRGTVNTEIGSLYLTMDRSNYLKDDSKGINFSMVKRFKDLASPSGYSETTGPYFWRNLNKHTWNEGARTWWESTRVGADIPASFVIKSANINSELEIMHYDYNDNQMYVGYETIVEELDVNATLQDWQDVTDVLNNSTNPIISKFNYNPLFEDTDNDGTNDVCLGIIAVGENYSRTFDFDDVKIINGSGLIEGKTKYGAYNPTYNDVRVSEDHVEIEKLTHMTFSADNCKIPGKTFYSWNIVNNSSNSEAITYNEKVLTRLFEEAGDYTVQLEIRDINGNSSVGVKNAFTIKTFPNSGAKGSGEPVRPNLTPIVVSSPAPSGTSGTSGTSGASGTSGTSGTSGLILNLRTV